jgi:predicted DCC family thiol-disulfide oxidoreductase YuxK
MSYYVIYDGTCNLCVNLVRVLENLDQGYLFQYIPMQDEAALNTLGISSQDCETGIILINSENLQQRWQGSNAAEEIGCLLPAGNIFVAAYRALPGLKWSGDRVYEQVRDNRYALFGKRDRVYESLYPACPSESCKL